MSLALNSSKSQPLTPLPLLGSLHMAPFSSHTLGDLFTSNYMMTHQSMPSLPEIPFWKPPLITTKQSLSLGWYGKQGPALTRTSPRSRVICE